MTYKEAFERVRRHAAMQLGKRGEDPVKTMEALDMAVEALDKQVPRNIIIEGMDESDWVYCPRCGETLGVNEDAYNSFCENNWQPIYCHKCGQAVVWEGL